MLVLKSTHEALKEQAAELAEKLLASEERYAKIVAQWQDDEKRLVAQRDAARRDREDMLEKLEEEKRASAVLRNSIEAIGNQCAAQKEAHARELENIRNEGKAIAAAHAEASVRLAGEQDQHDATRQRLEEAIAAHASTRRLLNASRVAELAALTETEELRASALRNAHDAETTLRKVTDAAASRERQLLAEIEGLKARLAAEQAR